MTITTHKTFCRYCHAYCPMDVDVEDGTVKAVHPDTDNEMYGGYTCIKGRQLVEQMYQPERLTSTRKKTGAGFETIDQPAKVFVGSRHGYWGAGGHFYNDSDVTLILGNNPMVSQYAPPGGVPSVSPFEKLREAKKRGQKLIAVDPRSTELTRRAEMHLQIQPGEDSTLLAAMIRLIIDEGLHDADFCAAHTEGLEQLRAAVEPYTLEYAAARTQIPADQGLRCPRRDP